MQIRERILKLTPVSTVRAKSAAAPSSGMSEPYTFVASDEEYDRYDDRIFVKGWKLESYSANPILLYNHDAGDGGPLGLGEKDVLPIGKAHVYVSGDRLIADVLFDVDDPFAVEIERKVATGILNAVSVRFLVHKYETNERGGMDCLEQELLELSIVTIPGNPRAVRQKRIKEIDAKVAELAKTPGAVREMRARIEQVRAATPSNEASRVEADTVGLRLELLKHSTEMQEQLARNVAAKVLARLESISKS